MEAVNKEFDKIRCFIFKKVNYQDVNYLALEALSIDHQVFLNSPIHKFEKEIEPSINHYLNLLEGLYEQVRLIFVIENKYFLDEKEIKRNLVNNRFIDIRRIAVKLKFDFKIMSNDGYISYYLITDILYEIEQRLELLKNLKLQAKPYLQFNNEVVENVIDFELFDATNGLREIEKISISSWLNISLNRRRSQEITTVIHVSDNNIYFDDAIKPEAKEEFEKWYDRFCIDEPSTDKIEIVLFFKLMNKLGYFQHEYNLHDLYLLTIDRSKRKIAFNTFKNNGRKKFEDWMDGKPEIPIFRD